MESSSWLAGLKVALTAFLALQAQGVVAVPFNNLPRAVGSRPAVSGYTYQGCYREPASGRALEIVKSESDMTLERCAAICSATTKTKAYFGTQYSKECWCGNTVAETATLADNDSECSSKCAGNSATFCGGSKRLSLYKDESYVPPAAPAAPSRVGDWLHQGCWTDGGNEGRTLSVIDTSDDMTIERCAAFAASKNMQYFGAEYGRECWAGNTPNPRQGLADDASSCNIQCKGNLIQICGGRRRMNLYKLSPLPSSTSTTAPTVTETPVDETVTHLDLSQATLGEGARLVEEGGKTLVELSATNGEARVSLPAQAPASVQPGDPIVVSVNLKVDAATIAKRQTTLTDCMLYIFLGGVQIHSSNIWTTGGSYTTVNTVPSGAPGQMSTLIIVQHCPAGAATITIGDVVVQPPPPAPSTSTWIEPPQTSSSNQPPQLPSSSQQPPEVPEETWVPPVSPVPSQQSSVYTPSSYHHEESSIAAPQTTSAPPPVQTISMPSPPAEATSYLGPPRPNTPCDRGDSYSCTLSGAPVATSGILAIVTPIAVAQGGEYQSAYNACARSCTNVRGCISFALDRGVDYLSNPRPYKCYLYSGPIGPYVASGPLQEYSHVVWFESSCFSCGPDEEQDSTVGPSSTLPPISSQTPPPAESSWVPPTSSEMTPPPAESTYTPSSSSEGPSVLTTTVRPYDPDSCQQGPGTCAMSGAPTATSGLIAMATRFVQDDIYEAREIQHQKCARLCSELEGCSSFVFDGRWYPWNCYFYSGSISEYTAAEYDPDLWPVKWFDNSCYECTNPPVSSLPESSAQPSAEQTYVPSSDGFETSTSTIDWPSSVTAPPSVPTRAVRLDQHVSCSIPDRDGWWSAGCTLSGAALKTTDLVAVATGVPAMTEERAWLHYQESYEICARACAEDDACGSWALDRGDWPATMDDWTCYLYSGKVRQYTSPFEGVDSVVYMDSLCFDCGPVSVSSEPFEWTSIYSSTSSTEDWGSQITSPPIPESTAAAATIAVDPYTPGVCSDTDESYACNISGWPKPTSGLIAVATGVPTNPLGDMDFEMQFEMCQRSCQKTPGCTFWALDRTNPSSWDCLIYDIDGKKHLDENGDIYEPYFDDWAFSLATCYNCTIPEDEDLPASSVVPTPTEPSTSPTAEIRYYNAPWYGSAYECQIAPYMPGQYVCNRPDWPTPTATSGLLGIATGLPPAPSGAQTGTDDLLPQYGMCLSTCMNVAGCQSWALDSSDLENLKCLMYDFTATWYVRNARPDADSAHLAWFDFNCIWCRPPQPQLPSTSTISNPPEITGYPSSTEEPEAPWTTTSSEPAWWQTSSSEPAWWQTSSSEPAWWQTSSSEPAWWQTSSSEPTSLPSSSSEPPAPEPSQAAPECARVLNPSDDDLACNLRGFQPPGGAPELIEDITSSKACAEECRALNASGQVDCRSFVFDRDNSRCRIYSAGVWDVLGDSPIAGRQYSMYFFDDAKCWDCL